MFPKITAALLAIALICNMTSAEAAVSNSDSFSLERQALKSKRLVTKRARTELKLAQRVERINASWEIRPSNEETLTDCLYINGTNIFCRFGRFAGGFESADGSRILVYAPGGSIEPRYEKGIFIFDSKTGEKTAEVEIRSGGPMVGMARPNVDMFVVTYQDAKDLVLETYNFKAEMGWRKRFPSSQGPGHLNLGISGDGSRIILGSIPIPLSSHTPGRVQVISRSGQILQDIPMAHPRVKVNHKGSTAVIWNTSGYKVYPFDKQQVVLDRHCDLPGNEYCLVQDISDDGRFVAAVTVKKAPQPEGAERLGRLEIVDMKSKTVHVDTLDLPAKKAFASRFAPDNSLTVEAEDDDISYAALP